MLIAIIENFSIEVGADKGRKCKQRKYILEAKSLRLIRGDKFERGGDTIAIPPKKLSLLRKKKFLKFMKNLLRQKTSSLSLNFLQIKIFRFL